MLKLEPARPQKVDYLELMRGAVRVHNPSGLRITDGCKDKGVFPVMWSLALQS